MSKLVADAYAKAEKAIAENKEKVELLAKTLLERETIDGRDVAKLVGLEIADQEKESPEAAAEPPAQEKTETEDA